MKLKPMRPLPFLKAISLPYRYFLSQYELNATKNRLRIKQTELNYQTAKSIELRESRDGFYKSWLKETNKVIALKAELKRMETGTRIRGERYYHE